MAPSKPVIAVLGGAGAMGRAAVYELARSGFPVRVLDADVAAAGRVARRYGSRRATVVAAAAGRLAGQLDGAAVVINCAPYRLNLQVMHAALDAGCHYLDLGGLFHTTRRQLRLDRDFRRAGLLAVLGMGSAPGLTNVLARAGMERLRRVRSIRIYNGGTDHTRYRAPLAFAFSPATLLDEITLRPMVYASGRFRSAAPLSGDEDFAFELGRQRTHLSLHSEVATLPLTYRRRGLRECAFKIAYDPELIARLKLLVDLGLASTRPGPRGVAPREVLLDCFRRMPPPPEVIDDRDSLAVVLEGEDARGPLSVRYDLTAGPQRRPPLSAVARNTGFPPALVAAMIAEGRIRERGVHPPETCVPARPLLAAMSERGIRTRERLSRPR
jgi:saccharopine dehydrogenase (NAD+, L-lysine-forming)